ncbi:MAG: MATE family efflux transporter [Rikenellaceae bacterium]
MSDLNNNQLINGGVARSLIVFTMPIIFALILQVMYGTVDLFIVGNFATIQDLSGVSTGSQVINTLTTLCVGFAMGTTILLGQKIGEKREKEVEDVISNSLILFMGISFVVMGLLLVFHEQLLNGMNTPQDAWQQTSNYIFYSSIGVPMIFAYNVLGSIFRGLGDSKTPLIAVGIACFANIVCDLLLVAYFNMGSSGAAIATVIAQGISVVASLYIVKKKKSFIYNIRFNFPKLNLAYIKKVVTLGLPIALQSGLTSLSFLFITLIVNKLGVLFSASVGITEKLTGVIMLIPLAFMQSISVFVAQNFGARDFRRTKRGLTVGLTISASFGFVTAYYSYFYGEHLIWLFNRDPEVIATAASYLKIYSFDVALVPFLFCLTGYLNGCGKTMYVMIQGVIGAIAIRLCLTYYLSQIEPVTLFRIGLATPIATTVQIMMCIYFYKRTQRYLKGLISFS